VKCSTVGFVQHPVKESRRGMTLQFWKVQTFWSMNQMSLFGDMLAQG